MKTVSSMALALMCLMAGIAYAQESPRERVDRANREFQELLQRRPTEEASVAIFFDRQMELREVIEKIRSTGIKVLAFRHGNQSVSGGYLLTPGESLDEAVEKYEKAHARFLETHLTKLVKLLETSPNASSIPSILSSIREAQNEQKRTQSTGFHIVGLDLRGSAESLATFRQQQNFVRVIEISKKTQTNIVP